jgi:hypothetical protein
MLALALAGPAIAGAQEATPAPRVTVPPCTAEPRPLDQLVALWFDANGAPLGTPPAAPAIVDVATLPTGPRPDDATVAAITEATQNWYSCLGAYAQLARAASFTTDHFISQFGPDLTNQEQDSAPEVQALLEAQLAATPAAAPEGGELLSPMSGPRRVRTLDDGRIGAIWALHGTRYFFIYKQVDGKWLIDDAITIVEPAGTPVAGTPTP